MIHGVKIIQVTVTKLRDSSGGGRDRALLVALCEDGSIWQRIAFGEANDRSGNTVGLHFNQEWHQI